MSRDLITCWACCTAYYGHPRDHRCPGVPEVRTYRMAPPLATGRPVGVSRVERAAWDGLRDAWAGRVDR